jgi:hypothetical protein
VAVTTYSTAQTGYEQAGVWVDTGNTNTTVQSTRTGGLQYTVPAPRELLFRSLQLNLSVAGGVGFPTTGTFTVSLVNELNMGLFSNTNLPNSQLLIPVYTATETFSLGSTHTVLFDLEQSTTSNTIGGWVTPGQVLQHSVFQGNIALVLTFTGTETTFATASLGLVIDQEPYLTGLPTTRRRYSSADWCPRCGTPIFREQLIRDGYTKGLVCPQCWDRDEERYPPFRPPKEINPR